MQGDEEDRTLAAVTEVMARLAAGDMAAMTTLMDRWGGPSRPRCGGSPGAATSGCRPTTSTRCSSKPSSCCSRWPARGRPRAAPCPGSGRGTAWRTSSTSSSASWVRRSMPAPSCTLLPNRCRRSRARRSMSRRSSPSSHAKALSPASGTGRSSDLRRRCGRWRPSATGGCSSRSRCRRRAGDPSPANTVGQMFGLQPATVRQIRCRVRRKLLGYLADGATTTTALPVWRSSHDAWASGPAARRSARSPSRRPRPSAATSWVSPGSSPAASSTTVRRTRPSAPPPSRVGACGPTTGALGPPHGGSPTRPGRDRGRRLSARVGAGAAAPVEPVRRAARRARARGLVMPSPGGRRRAWYVRRNRRAGEPRWRTKSRVWWRGRRASRSRWPPSRSPTPARARRWSTSRRAGCATPTCTTGRAPSTTTSRSCSATRPPASSRPSARTCTDVEPGDFVVLNWRAVCGECRACRRGRPWYCFATHNATQKMTLDGADAVSPALGIGAFAEKTLVAAGQAHQGRPGGAGPRRPACSAAASWPASAPPCSPARSAGATSSRCSAAAASATRPSPAPGSPARPRSSPSTSTTGSSSWPSAFGATHTVNAVDGRPGRGDPRR